MTTITVYHNPRCSKSRETLALVEAYAARHAVAVNVVDYRQTPLTHAQLTQLQAQLGLAARDMVRAHEEVYATLGLQDASDEALLHALAAHPELLQRPIVVRNGRAVIGRPPERVAAMLNAQ